MLFQLIYNTCILPTEWKAANIVPMHKKGPKDDIENYRPISLTSLVMETFERITEEELLYKTFHLLDDRKNGLLSQISCTSCMLLFSSF